MDLVPSDIRLITIAVVVVVLVAVGAWEFARRRAAIRTRKSTPSNERLVNEREPKAIGRSETGGFTDIRHHDYPRERAAAKSRFVGLHRAQS